MPNHRSAVHALIGDEANTATRLLSVQQVGGEIFCCFLCGVLIRNVAQKSVTPSAMVTGIYLNYVYVLKDKKKKRHRSSMIDTQVDAGFTTYFL